MTNQQIIAVTVVGDDRPGIVADVTSALADLHGNLEDSTMTLLRGHFAMILLVRTTASPGAVESALSPVTTDGSLTVAARVLREATPEAQPFGPAYSLRVHGADRPRIVASITRVIADHGATVVDLGTRLGEDLYVLTAELLLPAGGSAEALGADLRSVAGELGVAVQLAPLADDDVL
jgi:glycine cleavage system transcriptional repressor